MRKGLGLAFLGLLQASSALLACGDGDGTSAAAPTAEPAPVDPGPSAKWNEVLAVDQVDVLQGTTTTLVLEGEAVKKRNAPIIAGRPGLVRIHARLTERARVTALASELRVKVPGKEDVVVTDAAKSLVEYDPGDVASSFAFDLPDAAFAAGARMTMTLRDPKTGVSYTYPSGDGLELGAVPAPTLRVRFVPIKYNQDGSGRLPVLDARVVEQYRQSLYKLYPTSKVEVDLNDVFPWNSRVEADGTGWDQLLAAIMSTRRHSSVADDVYYVGVFEPAASLQSYCTGGCVLGVAPAPGIQEIGMRAALIIGYGSDGRNGTLAQELAHAMGRLHAPCGNAAFIDGDYPYANARLGVPGYDIVDKKIFDPLGRTFDFMSYCGPVWTSDYTYGGIFDRMVEVDAGLTSGGAGGAGTGSSPAKHTEQTYTVDARGELAPGAEIEVLDATREARSAPAVRVHFEDAAGHPLGTAAATFRPYDNIPGGIIVAPRAPSMTARVRADGLSLRR